jgi:hypothetical protein
MAGPLHAFYADRMARTSSAAAVEWILLMLLLLLLVRIVVG